MNIQLDDIRDDITRMVTIALEEDIGTGDITAELIPADKTDVATVITREDCVLCGTAWFDEVFNQLGKIDAIEWHFKDGDQVDGNSTLVTLKGNTRNLLTGERTALNFLQLLSGVATKSREYAKLVEGTNIKVLDTRKTIPGLRTAQKYAVTVGGCDNHRIGLYDAFLIKENHIKAAGGVTKSIDLAKSKHANKPIIVEVESLNEFIEACDRNVDRVMLDNFSDHALEQLDSIQKKPITELSGNLSKDSFKELRKYNGINYVSIGELTKSIEPVDLSLSITPSI